MILPTSLFLAWLDYMLYAQTGSERIVQSIILGLDSRLDHGTANQVHGIVQFSR